jgi:hypothetical protein
MTEEGSLLQVIYLARELRDARVAAAAATTTTNVNPTKSTGFLVAMGEEPAPRPTYRGRVISLAAMRSLSDAPHSTICAQCAPFLAALAAQGGAALSGYICTHGSSKRAGGGGGGIGVGAHGDGGGGGGGGGRAVPGAFLPRLDTADGFWSLGNAELASLPAAAPLPP